MGNTPNYTRPPPKENRIQIDMGGIGLDCSVQNFWAWVFPIGFGFELPPLLHVIVPPLSFIRLEQVRLNPSRDALSRVDSELVLGSIDWIISARPVPPIREIYKN